MKNRFLSLLLLLCVLFFPSNFAAAQTQPGLLLPIGAGYTDTYSALGKFAVENVRGDVVHILVLATPYSTNANHIGDGERAQNLKDAEERRIQTEGACKRNLPEGSALTCKVELLPIFTQEDANDPANLAYFTDDVSMLFILGGDQATGIGAIMNTPVEERITELHEKGMIVAGTSAGAAMQSIVMIADLSAGYGVDDGLFAGAVDIWNSPDKRGLPFGIQNAVVDQHFFQRARMGRLLNAIAQPNIPNIGVGVDAYTGIASNNEVLGDVFGLYTVAILDAETYHAADSVKYVTVSPNRPPIMSFRNVVYHLLSPGDVTYDLNTRTSSLANPPATLARNFDALTIPASAGPLILSGDLIDGLENSVVLNEFKSIAGDNIFIIATGYPSGRSADTAIKKYTDALGMQVKSVAVKDAPVEIPEGTSAVLVIGKNQAKVNMEALIPLKEFWLAGHPVMADNAAMPVFGSFYAPHEPTPDDAEREELAVQKSFWQGRTTITPSLGWVNITLEPQIIADKRFGRLTSLAYNHPELLSLGINKDTAIVLDKDGARVIGDNGVFVFDLRKAKLKLGTNDGFMIANAMLDVFVPGETLKPELADINARFDPAPTPVLPTPIPTATATSLPTPTLPATATVLPSTVTATLVVETASSESQSVPIWAIVGGGVILLLLVLWMLRRNK
ncbi:MAG: cyanophycinase [Anaerolineales bacterium]|nr:cyanophycinase [Anaerolineales bacterium]